jgi:hypothetical protein
MQLLGGAFAAGGESAPLDPTVLLDMAQTLTTLDPRRDLDQASCRGVFEGGPGGRARRPYELDAAGGRTASRERPRPADEVEHNGGDRL